MALPFGVSRQTDGGAGHDTGAPKRPLLATKVIITSLLALVFWAAAYLIIDSDLIFTCLPTSNEVNEICENLKLSKKKKYFVDLT